MCVLALAATLAYCAPADAAFTPFTFASGDPALNLQADYAYSPAISADGRYVVFTGSVASQPGVYREDLATETLEPVVEGTGAGAPSISAEGRYVSFTSDEDPEVEPATRTPAPGGCTSVYVRDMAVPDVQTQASAGVVERAPSATPGAYTLASVGDGAGAGSLAYAAPQTEGEQCGAATAAGVALSGDGRRVAFTILGHSDLTAAAKPAVSPSEPSAPCPTPPFASCSTPPGQVVVRDLEAQTTTLVSVTAASLAGAPQPVPGGAALTGVTSSGAVVLPDGAAVHLPVAASSAAISADGSTVAWMGVNVGEQVPVADPLPTAGFVNGYAEPLWRRIDEESTAPIRRVLAGDDPSAPDCPPECAGGLDLGWDQQDLVVTEDTSEAPAYGSFTALADSAHGFHADNGFSTSLDSVTPKLSENGMEVALLSTQPNYGEDPEFGLLSQTKPPPANAFVVNMTPGLTRAQAITRLTTWGSVDFTNERLDGSIENIAISPDGSRVLLVTRRVAFPLAPPALITPPLSQAAATQLYEANLQAGTLALVTDGYNGEPSSGEVFSGSLSASGLKIALASAAGNLAYGVVNQGSAVFVTEETDSPAVAGVQSITPLPSEPGPTPRWELSATVRPAPGGGALLLDVSVPGAGTLSAGASAAVSTTPARRARSHRAGRHAKGARAELSAAGRNRTSAVIATREVARASKKVNGPRMIELRLVPAGRYRSLADTGRLFATISVTFAAPGHQRLVQILQASFPRPHPIYKVSAHGHLPAKRKNRGRS
jgi:WD40-like Beta Propeller Repeat